MRRTAAQDRTGTGPTDVRRHNRALVLRTIREHVGASRAELSRLTRLSDPAILAIVNELLDARLIREDGIERSTGGRPARALRIAEQSRYVLAVDLARHRTRVAITDLNATILYQISVPTNDAIDARANLRWLEGLMAEVLAAWGGPRTQLLGIGVGAPGPLRTTTGTILAPTNFGHWHNLPLRSALAESFGVPVRVDNDANACALALQWFLLGVAARYFVYVAAVSVIGGGIVIVGVLYRGVYELVGEIGHMTIDVAGPLCPCGNIGCLELYTTLRATLARWHGTPQPETWADEASGMAALIGAAQAGDETARAALATSGHYLAVGVINAINAYDPRTVWIGRELAAAGDFVLKPIRDAVARRAFASSGRSVTIEQDPLGEDTPLLGAACLVLTELFVNGDILNTLVASSAAG